MKKVFLSLLTIIYMTASSGMAMEIHFCMGERTGADYFVSSGDTCGRCGMKEKKGGCCSDEQKFIKLSNDQKASSVHYPMPVLFAETLPLTWVYYYSDAPFLTTSFLTQTFADSSPPLYILHRVFRI